MNNNLEMVAEFHEMFEHPIGDPSSREGFATVESLEIRQLRIKLLFEELEELATAGDVRRTFLRLCVHHSGKTIDELGIMDNSSESVDKLMAEFDVDKQLDPINDGDKVNVIEELDALCDLEYVLMGKVLTAGLQEDFDNAFRTVHENNMTKAHESISHAMETVAKKNMDKFNIVERNGYFMLLNADGKLTKPHDHLKVKLKL